MKRIDAATARKWRCSIRTARRWRLAGAPVHDDQAMHAWLCGQQTLPSGTRKILDSAAPRPTRRGSIPAGGSEGAEHALRRLERAELAAFERFESAVAAGDVHGAKLARQSWLSITRELRGYDQTVARERREGDMLPAKEAREAVARFVWATTVHIRQTVSLAASEIRNCRSDGEADEVLKRIVDNIMLAVVAATNQAEAYGGMVVLTPWARQAVADGLRNNYLDRTDALVDRYVEALGKVFALTVQKNGVAVKEAYSAIDAKTPDPAAPSA